ncbi:LLM class flavin-dependent oxidoreductase [Bordetella genomosp. 10]|uniref:LLM class flavin-dependent oxidoreductase n=1 Tax=Bordetella genomosp. 10 TaxID=1416804 RepID=A0A261SLE3_9BORD|nr:LLM class flavin-dependent oxidoreductase [Bordetella genomosp. 10]OZI38238.1 LLM class flavin-dependent oxidoreductase [Bordetella genomosp. 10]
MNQPRKQMHMGYFHLPVGRHPAAWRRDEARGHPEDLAWAVEVARKAEAGLFDIFFLADNLVGPTPEGNGRGGGFEPLTLLGALAATTSSIGLAATVSTSFSEPFNVARMLASLDHLSGGRVAWNVVTSQVDRAAQNFGQEALPEHDERYARAAEFVEVVKGLWDTWDDGALRLDKESGVYVDLAGVRELNHRGPYYAVRGPLNVSRPPQGRPVIIQAGASEAGIALAGRIAEVAFTAQDTVEDGLAYRRQLEAAASGRTVFDGATLDESASDGTASGRAAAARAASDPTVIDGAGGAPARPLILPGIMPIIGRTPREAREKFAALQARTDVAAGIRQLSGRWGRDLSDCDLDGPVPEPGPRVHGVSRVRMLLNKARSENYTLRDLATLAAASYGHRIVVGSPEEIADDLEHWFRAGAADGFNLIPAGMPDGLYDFVDLVVPELQRRGLYRTRYESGTLRGHLGLPRPAPGQG